MEITQRLWLAGSAIDRPPPTGWDATSYRRRLMLRGALLGLMTGSVARVWMRTISDDHQFSVPGTLFILIVFSGLGAAAGLALAWRRVRSPRRMLVQRGVGLAPLLLMGPFIPLFAPSVIVATLIGHRHWRRILRASLWAVAGLVTAFFFLATVTQGPVGLAAFVLYLPLSYVMFITNRIALQPRTPPPPPSARAAEPFEPWLG